MVLSFAVPHPEFLPTKLTMALQEILSPQLLTLFGVLVPLQGARSFGSTHTSPFSQSATILSTSPSLPNTLTAGGIVVLLLHTGTLASQEICLQS